MPPPSVAALTIRARAALGLSQATLGELLGWSRRTIQRYDRSGQWPTPSVSRLAEAVHSADPALAAELAEAAGTTLEKLGLVKESAAVPPAYLTEAVVCAAAEALNVPPPGVRPALLAAFRRAREIGLRVEHVEAALSRVLESKKRGVLVRPPA